MRMRKLSLCAVCGLLFLPAGAIAQVVTVSVTNNQPMGGMTFSPLWNAFHDGSFDAFDVGAMASQGVEDIAELGNGTQLGVELGAAGVANTLASPSGPPPFTPGQTNSMNINVGDPTVNRYFSYGAMVVPSNDLFLGNEGATDIEVFDAGGNFLGPITIMVFGSDIWDAGTEVNDFDDGAAFIDGSNATLGTSEGGTVQSFFSLAGATAYMMDLNGRQTPLYTLNDPLESGDLVATITITPEPASIAMLAIGGIALVTRRRTR